MAIALGAGFEIFYWIPILTIFGYLIYLPGSKYLHLLAAAPNVFLKPLQRPKAMITTENVEILNRYQPQKILAACPQCYNTIKNEYPQFGARMFMEEAIDKRINQERAQEVIATGASRVAAACSFCITMLTGGIVDLEGDVEVKYIAEIIDEATE